VRRESWLRSATDFKQPRTRSASRSDSAPGPGSGACRIADAGRERRPDRDMRVGSVRYSGCVYAIRGRRRSSRLSSRPASCRVMPTSEGKLSDRKEAMKGSQKPKKLGKKPAQKTLKERRTAKRAAAKHASSGLDV